MSEPVTALLFAGFCAICIPVAVLLVQTLAAALPRRRSPFASGMRPRLAILVPAHDEASGIRATLETLMPQLGTGDRVLVVADNCTDRTAQIAVAAGAEVVERQDARLRGKGYALDFGLVHLEADPPEVVVIVDADCSVQAGALDRISRLCKVSGRPVQALYLMRAPQPRGASMAIAEFAWRVRNLVRPLGWLRLGMPCQLMGSGMAVEWGAIRSIRLASGHIAEDMQMGIDLARADKAPLFCPEALVTSEFPRNAEGTRTQRTRWEHGHIYMIIREVPRMLIDGIQGRGSGLIALALDICVPPLALLALILIAMATASAVLALVAGVMWPLEFAIVILLMFGAAVGLSWLRFGVDVISFRGLLLAFAYVPRKLPLYLKFLVRRQVEWVRSRRDGE
jgi:cellulose synthase/poly-beta-1,6-N-acetylglucosamine synthase-like glycosyltransferase